MDNHNPTIEATVESSTNEIINLLIVIDTDKVRRDFSNPSKDPNHPTGLNHVYQYMVVSNNEQIQGQGTADLNFHAIPGDVIRMAITSEYSNMDNPVFIYKINKFGGSDVFDLFNNYVITTKTVIGGTPNPLPPQVITETFDYYQANVMNKGTENYQVWFAMYQRQRSGDPTLVGYFYWDPKITVTV